MKTEIIGNCPEWLRNDNPEAFATRPHSSGKIARLPAEVRETINQALNDNVSYPEIVSRLEAMGHHGINPQNISNWFHSGYQRWLRHRERLDLMRLQTEANSDLLRQLEAKGPAACNRLNNLYASAQLSQLMQDIDLSILRDQLSGDPLHFFRLIRLIAAQTRNAYREQKLQLEICRSADVLVRSNVETSRASLPPAVARPETNTQKPNAEPPPHQPS